VEARISLLVVTAVADGLVKREGARTRDPKSRLGHVSPSGVYGDPTRATGQKGERVAEADLLAEIDALASAPVPGGTPRSPLDDESR
jgi:creatinine amidohydrolase/Fe(II)-dependent formamide hydrolase-like protein